MGEAETRTDSKAWWLVPTIPVVESQAWKDPLEFEDSLVCIVRPYFKSYS